MGALVASGAEEEEGDEPEEEDYLEATLPLPMQKVAAKADNGSGRQHVCLEKTDFRAAAGDCVLCLEPHRATFAAVPCGHQALCQDCVPLLRERPECPVCRARVDSFVKIFAVAAEPARDEELHLARRLAAEASMEQRRIRDRLEASEGARRAAERRATDASAAAAQAAAAIAEARQHAAAAHAARAEAAAAEAGRRAGRRAAGGSSAAAAAAAAAWVETDEAVKEAAKAQVAASIARVEAQAKASALPRSARLEIVYEKVS